MGVGFVLSQVSKTRPGAPDVVREPTMKELQLKFAGALDGADHGLGFVERFLVFEFGDGVGHDAGTGLHASLPVLHHQ